MKKNILVFQDENAQFCVVVGTNDLIEAETAVRNQEDEWYGKDHEEKPIPMEYFYPAYIYYGKSDETQGGDGEEQYYWGDKPDAYFKGKYTKEDGFVANLD